MKTAAQKANLQFLELRLAPARRALQRARIRYLILIPCLIGCLLWTGMFTRMILETTVTEPTLTTYYIVGFAPSVLCLGLLTQTILCTFGPRRKILREYRNSMEQGYI